MPTRVLDYGDVDPFSGVIGRPRDLIWPAHAYRVMIPAARSTGRDSLNPFERVILNVIDAVGGLADDALARETCIPVDLVRTVTLRLQDRDLIDSDHLIVDANRADWQEESREDHYTSALAFRELIGGKLLPFVQILDEEHPLTTKEAEHGWWSPPPDRGSAGLGPPTPHEVIAMIAQMKKRSAAYARSTWTPAIEQVRVEREPEPHFLRCPIAVQAHDAEYRIADPFGTGFSRVLEGVFAKRLERDEKLLEKVAKWKQGLANPKSPDGSDHGGKKQGASEPYDTPENQRRYPNLVRSLLRHRDARTVGDIYASLEWALYYACEAHDPGLAIRVLKQRSDSDFSAWLSSIAAGLGFEVPRHGFRPVPPGKFGDYLSRKAEMEPVLAIALVQADADPAHPLRALGGARPDFLARIRTLKRNRDERAHGTHVRGEGGTELESDPFMREVVSALLPTVQFGSAPTYSDAAHSAALRADAASRADRLLDARNALQGTLGLPCFNKLGPNAEWALLSAEQAWQGFGDGDDALALVTDLAAALEAVLRNFLAAIARASAPEGEYARQAGARALRVGLGQLPEALAKTNRSRIRTTLDGGNSTMGASVIALLLTAPDETLTEIADSQPDFLNVIAGLLAHRGHGNQPTPLSRGDTGKLRKSVIDAIGTLLELIQGD
jgi:hypothetical protein